VAVATSTAIIATVVSLLLSAPTRCGREGGLGGNAPEVGEETLYRAPKGAGGLEGNDHGLNVEAGALGTRLTGATVFATELALGTRLTGCAVFATELALGTGLTGCARCAGGVATVSTDMLSGELLGQVSRIADRANRGIAGLGGLGHSLGDSLAAELLRLGDFAGLGGGGGISSDDGHRGKFSVGGLKLGVAQAGRGGTGRFGGVLGGGFCRIFFGLHLCFLVWGVRVDADGGRGRGFAD
jgi:hypothetical protein